MTPTEPSAASGTPPPGADVLDDPRPADADHAPVGTNGSGANGSNGHGSGHGSGNGSAPSKVSIFATGETAAVSVEPVRPVRVARTARDTVTATRLADLAEREARSVGAPVAPDVQEFPEELPIDWSTIPLDDSEDVPELAVADAELDDELDGFDTALLDDLADDDYVVVSTPGTRGRRRGKLKARKVRRIVRYVSPWSVFKVSLLFNFCMWVIITIAGVILWQVADKSGQITNVEKFLAKLLAESSYTINGRDLFRAFSSAGVVLVFAGTGFMVLMSLLFNVICDITGGIRFTVLELESTRREIKTRRPEAVEARAAAGEFLAPVNRRGKPIRQRSRRRPR